MIQTLQGGWNGYELIDCGGGEKLERFGSHILVRPEPQALWSKSLEEAEWERLAHAIFRKSTSADKQAERGTWEIKKGVAEQWQVPYDQGTLKLTFRLGLTAFKHVGLFPEQALHWEYIYHKLRSDFSPKAKVLNLFAYTGAASLAANAAGAEVTHLDSVKQVISWSRENMELSGQDHIRWVVEDALKFVQREVRRGNTYQGIILDPPAYGRGPDGEKWVLEEHLMSLLESCSKLLIGSPSLLIMNLYSLGFSALILENLLKEFFPSVTTPEIGELYLQDRGGRKLPLGTYGRFVRN